MIAVALVGQVVLAPSNSVINSVVTEIADVQDG